jgi:hypothetical protein
VHEATALRIAVCDAQRIIRLRARRQQAGRSSAPFVY